MVVVHSATKGLAAMTLAMAAFPRLLDYEQPVCAYWPEFAQHGKQRITVRQLLAHQAALFAIDEPVDRSVVADLDRLAIILARQKPAWEPGTRQAYHAMTLGFYEGELLRRVDPQHRSLGQFFQDEIATPWSGRLHSRSREYLELAVGNARATRTPQDACGLPDSSSRSTRSTGTRISIALWSSIRGRVSTWIHNVFMRATWRCRRAARSPRHEPSRVPIAYLRRAAASLAAKGDARSACRARDFPPRMGSMMNA
jgi:hypothetical protein